MSRTVVGWIVLCFSLASPARAQFMRGDLYVAEWPDKIVRVVPGSWSVTTFADASDRLNGASAVTFSTAGTLLCGSFHAGKVLEFDASGHRSVRFDSTSGLSGPYGESGMACDANGCLFVADFNDQAIRYFPADGGPSSILADTSQGVVFPDGLALAASGDLFVANRGAKNVLQIAPTGEVKLFDKLPDEAYSIVVRSNGDLYVACGLKTPAIYRYPGGDAAQRTLFATFPHNSGNPVLQFSPDEATLYFTSYATGNLLTVDPDSGAFSEVIAPNGLPGAISIGVYGRGVIHAAWRNYGSGFPGTNGVPSFTAREDPVLGTTSTLDLSNSSGVDAMGLLYLGFLRSEVPATWGGDLLVTPFTTLPLTVLAGGQSFSGDLPADPSLSGLAIDLQVIEDDAGAAGGVSATPGLELLLGI
jgi:sugar lactone lactonase YvrE